MTVFASTQLSGSGKLAELSVDDLTEDGVVLHIDGAEQSHVERGDPQYLLHDYLRRMRSVLTACAPRLFTKAGPEAVLHLGAGALTLPRWMQAQWPQVDQTAVDYEPELMEFVLTHLPMRSQPETVVADAAAAMSNELAGRRFDVVVVDLFNSAASPAHLRSGTFFTTVIHALTPQHDAAGSLLLLNFGDDPGLSFARELIDLLLHTAATQAGVQVADVAATTLLSGPDTVMAGVEEGNMVFALCPGSGFSDSELAHIWAAGPHPGEVVSGVALMEWLGTANSSPPDGH